MNCSELLETLVIVAAVVFQIVYIRRIFEVKSIV
jgi:hypothetical protein